MNQNNIYSDIILEHSSSKINKHHMENANIVAEGKNPSCGDEITLELKVENGIIEDGAYTGIGCAISEASTSIMLDLVKGRTVDEAKDLAELFFSMIKRENSDDNALEPLEDAIALKNISNMPARVKCATMPWHTLADAILTLPASALKA